MKESQFQQLYRTSTLIYCGSVMVVLVLLVVGVPESYRFSQETHTARTKDAIIKFAKLLASNYPEGRRELQRNDLPHDGWNQKLQCRWDLEPARFWISATSPDGLIFEYDSKHPEKGVYTYPF